jgi:hypothetical protein
MRSPTIFLIAIVLLLPACNCNKQEAPEYFNFKLAQPDGTIPELGYAIVFEKHVDPSTGITTMNVPVSDTIYCIDCTHSGEFYWYDDRGGSNHPLVIECFSSEDLTSAAIRKISIDVDYYQSFTELNFPQERPLKVLIRHIEPFPSPVVAWSIIITPFNTYPTGVINTTIIDQPIFDSMSIKEWGSVTLTTKVLFEEHSIMYCHLFRHDGSSWQFSGTLDADIKESEDGFQFNTQHSLLCDG